MIRVLHIITRLDVGGSAENTIISATRMPSGEFESVLIAGRTADPIPRLGETLHEAGVAFFEAPSLVRSVRLMSDCRALWQVSRLIRKVRPDIVHAHSSKAGFIGRLAAKLAGVQHIVYTPHGHVFQGYFSPLVTRGFIMLERTAARWTDRILTLTDAESEQHLALGIGRPGQFVTIPSGIDIDAVLEATPTRVASDGFVIGTIGRLAPIKGHAYLIEAVPAVLSACPTASFVFVGDGEMRPILEERARTLGVSDRVIFAGYREDVSSLIAGMDMVVLPSLNEGMGRVLVMAMALGKPIVATRVGGVPELLADGAAGRLIAPADPVALAEAICTLTRNPEQAKALGEAGRSRAVRYTADAMVKSLAQVYRDVMADNAR